MQRHCVTALAEARDVGLGQSTRVGSTSLQILAERIKGYYIVLYTHAIPCRACSESDQTCYGRNKARCEPCEAANLTKCSVSSRAYEAAETSPNSTNFSSTLLHSIASSRREQGSTKSSASNTHPTPVAAKGKMLVPYGPPRKRRKMVMMEDVESCDEDSSLSKAYFTTPKFQQQLASARKSTKVLEEEISLLDAIMAVIELDFTAATSNN